MKKRFLCLFLPLSMFSCEKICDDSIRMGEIVEIPVEFVGFSLSEINNILVYRIDKADSSSIDTFQMRNILWSGEARTSSDIITDRAVGRPGDFGHYDSYFDNCHLVLDWHSSGDTLSDFEIKKSREDVKGCHSEDPNIRIDKLSFLHNGKTFGKREGIRIVK